VEYCLRNVDDVAAPYVDDIVVGTDWEGSEEATIEQHNRDLLRTLEALKEHKLVADQKKCKFFVKDVEFCGHILGGGKGKPSPGKLMALEKWDELVIGTVQIVLGLTVDTNKLTVGITPEYRDQVRKLLNESWPTSRRIFKVADIQKLVGKLARLGEGAPWIYKIMSHIYTSLAFALKQNKELLLTCTPKFCEIVGNIECKQFSGNQSEFARELNSALKTADLYRVFLKLFLLSSRKV
jgi:hypothetical protein